MSAGDRKWEQSKDEAANAAHHAKQAAGMKVDEMKDAGWQKKEEVKDNVNWAADRAGQKVDQATHDVKHAARDMKNQASDKWEETKYNADVKSKEFAHGAIDSTRRATDAADSTVNSQLDRAEAHVDDQKSFAAQAGEGATHLLESAKEGAAYVAGGASYVAGVVGSGLATAAEGAANLASQAYVKVAGAVDSVVHPGPQVGDVSDATRNMQQGDSTYYSKEEKTTVSHAKKA